MDYYEYCDAIWGGLRILDWLTSNGINTDPKWANPSGRVGPYGPAIACLGSNVLLTSVQANDASSADSLVGAFDDLDELFPEPEYAAVISGATGSYSYSADATGTSVGLDLRKDLRVISVQLLAPDVQVDEATAREFLESVGVLALRLEFPPVENG